MRFMLAAALLISACATDPALAPRDCTPGTTTGCVCPGVLASGVQVCSADGQLGACMCPDAGGLADVVAVGDSAASPSDANSPPDRQEIFDAQETSSMRDGAAEASAVDRPDVQPDRAMVDVTRPDDVVTTCTGGNKHPCRTNLDCQTQCLPHPSAWMWCCTMGGECFATSRPVCQL